MPKSMDITEDCALAPEYVCFSESERTAFRCIACDQVGVDSALLYHLDPPERHNLPYFSHACHLRCFLNSKTIGWAYLIVPIKWVH